jgi:Subtilase family/Bacterial Ig domain
LFSSRGCALLVLALLLTGPVGLAGGARTAGLSAGKVDQSLLAPNSSLSRIAVLASGSPSELDKGMNVAYTIGGNKSFIAFGSTTRGGLASLASLPDVERVFPDAMLNYNDSKGFSAGGGQVQADMFRIRQLLGVNQVNSSLHVQGTGVDVAIVDSGTDFANPNMQNAYATDINGYPIAVDPDGSGIVITNATYTSFSNSTGVYLNMTRNGKGSRVPIYLGAATYPRPVIPIIWDIVDFKVGNDSSHYIVSKSGVYHFGIAFEWTPQGYYFFPMLVVDSRVAGVYDTVYVDFRSAPRLSELLVLQNLPDANMADWSFYGQSPHRLGDGTAAMYASLSGDGVPDISAGLLGARVLDVFGAITGGHSGFDFDVGAVNGTLLAPMDPEGNYLGVMYDFEGHGSQTAANVASSGSQPYAVYGNGTLYPLAGVAPGAKIIPVKALWIGDTLYGWMWASGFDYSASRGTWVYTGDHKASIVSNSWGDSEWPLFNSGLGYDIVSLLEDALSTPGSFSPSYPGTVFVQAMGNGGPGYGTVTSPASASFAISVGASTSWHVASQFSSTGLTYYGGASSYSGDVISWSDRGPGLTGEVKPDLVSIGAFGFTPTTVMQAGGNSSNEWAYFGGTSQATPLTAGVAALVVQALESKHTPVTPGLVKQILMSTAQDLGSDPFVQGAGQVNATAAVSLALKGSSLMSSAFMVGTTSTYANLASILSPAMGSLAPLVGEKVSLPTGPVPAESWFVGQVLPGGSATTNFTITDPTGVPLEVTPSSSTYRLIGTANFTETSIPGESTYVNLTSKVGKIPQGTDLMTVSEYYPFTSWDDRKASPYYADAVTRLRLQVYNWVDSNHDGAVQYNETAIVNTDYGWSNTELTSVSRPDSKFTGTPVVGVYQNPTLDSYWFGQTNESAPPVRFGITVSYFEKVPWEPVTFSGGPLSVAAWSSSVLGATVSVPADAPPGTYEGFIDLSGSNGQRTQVPVSYVVPISPAEKNLPYTFGGNSAAGGELYSNGAIFGAADFSWRYESGNWRAFHVDVTDPTVNQGTVKVQWNSSMTSLSLMVLDPQGRIVASSTPAGLYKSITRNFIELPYPLLQPSGSNDYLGVSPYGIGWAGGFAPAQNEGPNSSVLAFPVNETGTYTVVVHNTVVSGSYPAEAFKGTVALSTVEPITTPPGVKVLVPTAPVRGVVDMSSLVTGEQITQATFSVDSGPSHPLAANGSFSIDTTKLPDGPNTVTITATDSVGLTASQSFVLTVLNTPPQVTIANPLNGSTVEGDVPLTFLARSNYIASITAEIDGKPLSTSGGSYLWDSASAPDGTHTLKVVAVDKAGNVGTSSVTFSTNNQAGRRQLNYTLEGTFAVAALLGAGVALAATRPWRRRAPEAPMVV